MAAPPHNRNRELRYQADEVPPELLSLGLGIQYTLLTIAPIILVPSIIVGNSGMGGSYLAWSILRY